MIAKINALRQYTGSGRALGRKVRASLQNPAKAWTYLRRIGSRGWIRAVFTSYREYRQFVSEIEDSELMRNLQQQLRAKFAGIQGTTVRGNAYIAGTMLTSQASCLYAVIRKKLPEILVETGVCNGFSSAVILAALEKNGKGHLYSIDYPEFTGSSATDFWEGKGGAVVPNDNGCGWLVPRELRDRWTLKLGKSSVELPALLTELDKIDLFLHDSEHSFENQLFEFRLAFKHLTQCGALFASDISWSQAFDVFSKEIAGQARCYFVDPNLALVLVS